MDEKWTNEPNLCEHKESIMGLCLHCGTAARGDDILAKVGTHALSKERLYSSRNSEPKVGDVIKISTTHPGMGMAWVKVTDRVKSLFNQTHYHVDLI